MDSKRLAKQMISFQKAIFNSSFHGLNLMQEQSKNMTDGFLRQFPWVNEASKKPLMDSMDYLSKTRKEYKNAVDQGFTQLEDLIDNK